MATTKFSRIEFEKNFKLTKEIQEKIGMFGTQIESITDTEIELEILPNRPDLFSIQGFTRAFSAYLGKSTGQKKYLIQNPGKDMQVTVNPSVNEIRPYTLCAIVKNLTLSDERIKTIIDLQEKLHQTLGRNRKKFAIGIYPLEKISLPISYEARTPEKIKFIPLEYDQELDGRQILSKHEVGKKYASLLEHKKKYPVFVDNKGKILSMPPIINSEETGRITNQSNEVFVECSGFNLELLNKILWIILTTLADMQGTIYAMNVKYPNKTVRFEFQKETRKIDKLHIEKILGIKFKDTEIKKLLEQMEYIVSGKQVIIPPWRVDIMHDRDIIEDVAIAYGYDKIIPLQSGQVATGSESKTSKLHSKLREIIVGLGYVEVSSYHLIKQEDFKKISSNQKIEIENSKTEYKFLRSNLITPLLRILSENKDTEYPQKIFEIGTVFSIDSSKKAETGIKENDHLILAISPGNSTEILQIAEYICRMIQLPFEIKQADITDLVEGRSAELYTETNKIGYFGEVHPETLIRWGIKMPVSILEINLSALPN